VFSARGPVLAVCMGVAIAAHGQPRPPPAAQEAAQRFDKAFTLYTAGNYEAALAEFEAAYAVDSRFEVLFNIAVSQKRLFRYDDARKSFARYLELGRDKVPAARRAAVEKEVDEMLRLTARVSFRVLPEGARITVDGVFVGAAPLETPRLVGPGRRLILVEADGHTPQRLTLELVSGAQRLVEVTLERVPTEAVVEFTSAPRARLFVDGLEVGLTPVIRTLVPGGHALRLEAEAYQTHRQDFIVLAGQRRTLAVTLDALPVTTPWYRRWYVWAIVGTVVVASTVSAWVLLRPRPDVVLQYP
jgi:tetratricopeptide (TPR) repeat protein